MPVIEVANLHKRYREHTAVADVSFTVERGEIFGILGPNGAGKTTTVECVTGLRARDGGTVRVLGEDPAHAGLELRAALGVQLQQGRLPDKITVWEALDLYASFYPEPASPERLIEEWGLREKRNTAFRKLSGGQKQRLLIALALIGNPKIAVLDELTTGLDPQARRDTWELVERVRDNGVTVLLVTHFMAEAERLCDRIAVIDQGRVVALDTPSGLVASVRAEVRIRFRPSIPLPPGFLESLPDVSGVDRSGSVITVRGTGNLLHTVTATLARAGIVAEDLRLDQTGLDDAFVALTGTEH
ncbi:MULTISPECIES: ABC transporter ATP-binding protein [unclassified Crossiella]|uniref:ABC transporter ATP-binding protein n=1 Tax=unclassified Crossiella TaxID=2620835 RepID=UPI001FFE6B68|nr:MULTISPECIES: ABC transporter ATP-binding protein [unclassified Crossiella]MCK2243388.1 ABC transporter ATP-binding protein [Crossiella sp. S99.2]MCK2254143.1 ABC transporter ATP-binding protein [Crossiella sp. S99.1]